MDYNNKKREREKEKKGSLVNQLEYNCVIYVYSSFCRP